MAYGVGRLHPGMTVLDLGCGPGTITTGIARLIAPGRVIAVDNEPAVIEIAEANARTQGIDNIDFQVMDGYDLALEDDSIDFAHAHQVLQHVSDPVAILSEMVRVTKPGGVIAVRDSDYSSFAWYPKSPELDRWMTLYQATARGNGGEPDAGRYLLAWAHQAGLREVASTSSTWTYPAGEAAHWWGNMWADRILNTTLAEQILERDLATRDELERINRTWIDWADDPDAWFMVPSGELLGVVPDSK